MKKIILASSVILLMAAGCSSTTSQTPVVENTSPTPTFAATPTMATTPTPTATMASPTPTATPTKAAPASIVVLKLGSSSGLGQYLTAANGMTLYTSSADSANMSNCTGACATNWPAYTITAGLKLSALTGISGKIGTITRADGTTQVTYNGLPLYFWVNDAKAGDTTGQGIGGFAVVKP